MDLVESPKGGARRQADQATQASPGAATASPPSGECPSRSAIWGMLHRFPRPPVLSGNSRPTEFLLFMAEHEKKKGATHRAKEALAIYHWLIEIKQWYAAERTGA